MVKWINGLWLSFMTAGMGEFAFFALVDPQELYLLGRPVHWSPMAVYSVGFLLFWGLTAATAGLVLWLQKSAVAVNQEHRALTSGATESAAGHLQR